ncbi:MAG: hypothetical protein LUG66_05285 [Clostridiales bacterium]|nr:hypothetical protein [Clostridiales bacterium]
MKKVYTKPAMEIVSFNLSENITTGEVSAATIKTSSVQTNFTTINY